MATTTSSVITAASNAVMNRTLLMRANAAPVHRMFGLAAQQKENGSKVLMFRRYGNLTNVTSALTEGVTPANKALSITNVSATLAQYGTFVTITDVIVGTAIEDVEKELIGVAGILGDNVAQSLDVITRDVIIAGTTKQFVTTSGANATRASLESTDILGATAAHTEIRKAVKTLKGNLAKRFTGGGLSTEVDSKAVWKEHYIGIVHPNVTANLKRNSAWVDVKNYPSNVTPYPFEVGYLDEVRFVESTNAKVYTGSATGAIDAYGTLILGQEAYGVVDIAPNAARGNLNLQMIVKDFGTVNDPLNQRMHAGWKAMFAAVRLNENFMLRLESTAA